MNEEEIKKQIALLEKCTLTKWDEVDLESQEEVIEELLIVLYELRKQINEIIEKLDLTLLARLARVLYILSDISEDIGGEVLEELDMFFYFENIGYKIEEQRNISWNELLKYGTNIK